MSCRLCGDYALPKGEEERLMELKENRNPKCGRDPAHLSQERPSEALQLHYCTNCKCSKGLKIHELATGKPSREKGDNQLGTKLMNAVPANSEVGR